MGIQWTCMYCGRFTTITEPNIHNASFPVRTELSRYGESIGINWVAIACPNPDCKELSLTVALCTGRYTNDGWRASEVVKEWKVLPDSIAKPQPEYIPEALRNDYSEAARIVELSPKASATLSRRCLQGMIRDFWKVSNQPSLYHEIQAIEDKVDPQTWAAIDAVRGVGNIGAHMEQDINLIVDVDPDEARLLLELIETLFRDWYVDRHERTKRMSSIKKLASDKQAQRKRGAVQAPKPASS